jgi:hypothetical protein
MPFTQDEATNGGIGTAMAIKTDDPTAKVSGPVIDHWWGLLLFREGHRVRMRLRDSLLSALEQSD